MGLRTWPHRIVVIAAVLALGGMTLAGAAVSPGSPAASEPDELSVPSPTASTSGGPTASPSVTASPSPTSSADPSPSGSASPTGSPSPTVSPSPSGSPGSCTVGARLRPTCGLLWGAAPAAHTDTPLVDAVHQFEDTTGRTQTVFHTYHRGIRQLFPTADEMSLATDPYHPRVPFINWKPAVASWAAIADGDPEVDAFIDRLASHIKATYPGEFFLTIHHEPENDVDPIPGSGYTASDYADMFRHVVERLRADGVHNAVTVMTYMAYVKWCTEPWHDQLYPGDDVVDWVAWDVYAYSTPGYGYGDFAEMVNRGAQRIIGDLVLDGLTPGALWPGFYDWATEEFPDKPLMLGEWGVWSGADAGHKAWFYRDVAAEISRFPRLEGLVYFATPDDRGRDSTVDHPADALPAYRDLGSQPEFQVQLPDDR